MFSQSHSDLYGQSRQTSGAMGQAPLECGAPTKKVKGFLQGYLQMRRFTTGHRPPEAFCHLPKLQRAREPAPPALERNPHET